MSLRQQQDAVNSSQQWQHSVWGTGQLVTTTIAASQLVVRFWAVTSWPCDELTGSPFVLRSFGRPSGIDIPVAE